MSRYLVRPAVLDDAETIVEAHLSSVHAAHSDLLPPSILAADERSLRPLWRTRLSAPDQHDRTLVAVHRGEIVGYLHSRRDDETHPTEIRLLYVRPEHWRHGVGTVLIVALLAALGPEAERGLVVWTMEKDVAARAFYERCGFRHDGSVEPMDDTDVMVVRYATGA